MIARLARTLPPLTLLLLTLPVLGALLAPGARAQTPPFTRLVVFGDSLSDDGNVADVTNGAYGVRFPGPQFNYADGRFTDGAGTMPAASASAGLWHEQLAALLPGLPRAAPSLEGGTDHAYGDATTAGGTSTVGEAGGVSVTVDNLGKQVSDTLAAGPADPGALYVVWGGANDLYADSSAASVTATAGRVGALVRQLGAAGARSILVPNVPPLGDTPDEAGQAGQAALDQAASSYRTQLNAALDSAQSAFAAQGLTVHVYRLDVFSLFGRVVSNPAAYGFTNVTQSAQGASVNADQFLFWDGRHPTVAGHARLAAAAYDVLFGPASHLLWSNPDGKAAFWNVTASGAATVAGIYGPFTDGAAQNTWRATGLASGLDGVSHLLWNNPDGKVALWSVTDGGAVTGTTGFGPYADGQSLWRASGLSVGPDNVIHLLWTNPDGHAAFWNVTPGGSPSVLAGYGPFTDGSASNLWAAVGVSTGPDNVSHLLWSNPDGKAAFWTVSDTTGSAAALAGYGPFTDGSPQNPWGAVGVSTGPDNVSHLLWHNSDGKAAFWSVSDADGSATALAGYGPYADGSSPWAAAGLATGPDNVSRLLWTNPDGHAALWLLGASGSASSVAGFGPYTDGVASNLWSAVGVSAGP